MRAKLVLPEAPKNLIINGSFDYWQRGTSYVGTSSVYLADRWVSFDCNVERQELGVAKPFNTKSKYFSKITIGNTSNFKAYLQRIEDMGRLSGTSQVVSLWLKGSVAGTIVHRGYAYYGVGGSESVSFGHIEIPVTTEWVKVSFIVKYPSSEGKTLGSSNYFGMCLDFNVGGASEVDLYSNTNVSAPTHSGDISIADVMLHEGGEALDEYVYAGGDAFNELTLCKRYYWRETPLSSAYIASVHYTYYTRGNKHPVVMRTSPTMGYSGNIQIHKPNNYQYTATSASFATNPQSWYLEGGLPVTVVDSSAYVEFDGYIEADAEL